MGWRRDDTARALNLLRLLLLLKLTDLLHLEHPLHDELVLALLVDVALVLALPWKKKLSEAALVERNKEMGALVAVGDGNPVLLHLLLRRDHRLRRSQLHLLRHYSTNRSRSDSLRIPLLPIEFLALATAVSVSILPAAAAIESNSFGFLIGCGSTANAVELVPNVCIEAVL